ncbi:hypothetical protein DRW03_19980 [Corallococcus sp. H22C18031201]|uniref:hypothetical protein n=1 Tax=Citreicoccus inhibens TaxID=2849499 RepID=UPI000E73BF3B|nr:hypothetical protein [Citreicoccus inhibens]MBU8895614.1 hypothetical protein [Citreicoccus inhibens]RJS20051.1 hypothetical protein DRW03_19980 [Corallococcus sp. H22C18031201]
MDGGLAVFGFGLFILSIANLYARSAFWLAWSTLALSLIAMGMAFSESKRLREWSLGIAVALGVLTLVALVTGTAWWLTLATFLFAAAFGILWAEYRFPYFEHVSPTEAHSERRFHVHWPWHRRHTA